MRIDLTKVLSQDGNVQECEAPLEMAHFKRFKGEFYKILERTPVHLVIQHEKDQVLTIRGTCRLTFQIACARCLKPVRKTLELDFFHRADMLHPEEDEDGLEAAGCMTEDKQLDVEQLLHNEILINWPLRVLCRDDCQGICPVCGQDLNAGSCSCDRESLDPRMAAFKEVFSKFKEV